MSRALRSLRLSFQHSVQGFLETRSVRALFIPFAARQVCRITSRSMTSTNFCW